MEGGIGLFCSAFLRIGMPQYAHQYRRSSCHQSPSSALNARMALSVTFDIVADRFRRLSAKSLHSRTEGALRRKVGL
jgi:hypothetical protein